MTYTLEKPSATSAGLMNASMLVYLFWLLLPAVQTTGRAATGAAAVALFGAGVLLDGTWLKAQGFSTLLRAVCAALMPLILRVFLARGGENGPAFMCSRPCSGSRWSLRAMRASEATAACGAGCARSCWL